MFDVPLPVLLAAFAAFLLAGFVKGFIGMGLPTVATGLLTIVMAPAQAAGLLVMPNFVTNVWQAFAGRHLRALLRRFWPMLAGIFIGTAPGAGFLTGDMSGPRRDGARRPAGRLCAAGRCCRCGLRVPPHAEWWLAGRWPARSPASSRS